MQGDIVSFVSIHADVLCEYPKCLGYSGPMSINIDMGLGIIDMGLGIRFLGLGTLLIVWCSVNVCIACVNIGTRT